MHRDFFDAALERGNGGGKVAHGPHCIPIAGRPSTVEWGAIACALSLYLPEERRCYPMATITVFMKRRTVYHAWGDSHLACLPSLRNAGGRVELRRCMLDAAMRAHRSSRAF